MKKSSFNFLWVLIFCTPFSIQAQKSTDANTPLHALKPNYPVAYEIPTVENVKEKLTIIYNYLNTATPAQLIHKQTGAMVDVNSLDSNTIFKPGDFRLTSYEWGVTYAGMLAVGKATNDNKFSNYTSDRLGLIGASYQGFKMLYDKNYQKNNPLRSVIDPKALDDAGSICASILKTIQFNQDKNLQPLADNFLKYISKKQQRLEDGTLARSRPQANTLWLDDLFMSVPALAQAGKLTGNNSYYDDAVKQVLQFSEKMFNKDKNLYMHGWVASMKVHPEFYWARANGWAILTMVELLDVLPKNYPGRETILQQLLLHIKGLSVQQTASGFWHQLLDKNDSYLETSATAIYCYAIARAINNHWIEAKAYGPMVILAWNAVASKINKEGQVEGTCVGTGLAFDPAFYYYRPTSVYAAHGYGPVLLAGAEMINLINSHKFEVNDSAIHALNN
jgi:rhamnogalacturonyl hydrolase YesR